MLVKVWVDTARRAEYRGASEHERVIDVFQGLLEGNITPDTAAGNIASMYEPLIRLGGNVGALWGILCDATRDLGGNQELTELLVDLLNSISQLPDVTNDRGNALTPKWSNVKAYWRSLPDLSWIFREHGIGN